MTDFKTYEAKFGDELVQKSNVPLKPITGTFEEVKTPQGLGDLWSSWKGLIMIVTLSCAVYALTDEFGALEGTPIGIFSGDNVTKNLVGKKYTSAGKLMTQFAGPMVFGFLDNFGMMIGMEVVEIYVKAMGVSDSDVIAMFGNTISDGVGALMGGAISSGLVAWTAYDGAGSTALELFGVMFGCLIPPFGKMAANYFSNRGNPGGINEDLFKSDQNKRMLAILFCVFSVGILATLFILGKAEDMKPSEQLSAYDESVEDADSRYPNRKESDPEPEEPEEPKEPKQPEQPVDEGDQGESGGSCIQSSEVVDALNTIGIFN